MPVYPSPSPSPVAVRAVIYDLDGVLYDSLASNVAYYNHILQAIGHPARAEEALEVIHRDPTDLSLAHLLGGRGPEHERAMAYARVMDTRPFVGLLSLYPHAAETLRALNERLPLAVATNRTTTARSSLKRFGLLELFKEVVTPLDTGVPKPDPAIMELTLARLGLAREEVIYVGDTSVDEGLCQASRVRFIAFRNPSLQAWAHVEDHREIPGLLGL